MTISSGSAYALKIMENDYKSIEGHWKAGIYMKTLFDLRVSQNQETYETIQNLYEEPLKIVQFEAQSITACMGCWSCWVKTPGRCVMKDRMAEIYPDYMGSDTVILLMDTAQGFISQ